MNSTLEDLFGRVVAEIERLQTIVDASHAHRRAAKALGDSKVDEIHKFLRPCDLAFDELDRLLDEDLEQRTE